MAEQFEMEGGIAVHFDHPFNEVVERVGIVRREKTPCVEVSAHEGVAPVDRNRVGQHRLDNLFRGVARVRLVLKGDRELVVAQEGLLVPHPVPERVEHLAAGVNGLVAGESSKKVVSSPTQRIGDDERAEALLTGQNSGRVMVGRLHERHRIDIERPMGHAKMARIGRVFERKRPVARAPVGRDVLTCVEDPQAVPAAIVPSPLADIRKDNEVRIVAEFEAVALAQQPREEVVVCVEAVPKADELQPDGRACLDDYRRRPAAGPAHVAAAQP